MKRVLIALPSLTGGGAERVASVWASMLAERGYDVSVLVFYRAENEYELSRNVKVFAVCDTLREYLKLSYFRRYRIIRKAVKAVSPCTVISFLPSVQVWIMFASLGLKAKRIDTIRINPWRIGLKRGAYLLWKLCYRTTDAIILQTPDQKPFFDFTAPDKCVIIPNPVSDSFVESYQRITAEHVTRFIAAGRISPQKNYEMMIRGFAKAHAEHPEIVLDIFGAGEEGYKTSLKELIHTLLMDDVIFLHERSASIQEEYLKSDVFLMTSDYEGMPNALAEAMASRLICVSTDCLTGPRSLIDPSENGFLIPTGDSDALSDAISQVLTMQYDDRVQMAEAARQKAVSFCSRENSLLQLCKLLDKLD